MSKVFLGGTCNGSTWRDEIIPRLECDFFNPVVEDWTASCQAEEERQKNYECDTHLYVITSDMIGVYSIAEAVQSSNDKTIVTIFTVLMDGFSTSQRKSLKATSELISSNDGYTFNNLSDTVTLLNEL